MNMNGGLIGNSDSQKRELIEKLFEGDRSKRMAKILGAHDDNMQEAIYFIEKIMIEREPDSSADIPQAVPIEGAKATPTESDEIHVTAEAIDVAVAISIIDGDDELLPREVRSGQATMQGAGHFTDEKNGILEYSRDENGMFILSHVELDVNENHFTPTMGEAYDTVS